MEQLDSLERLTVQGCDKLQNIPGLWQLTARSGSKDQQRSTKINKDRQRSEVRLGEPHISMEKPKRTLRPKTTLRTQPYRERERGTRKVECFIRRPDAFL